MVSTIVVELPSSDEEEEKVPEVKPKASKGMSCSVFFFYYYFILIKFGLLV